MYRYLVFCVYIFGAYGFNFNEENVKTVHIKNKSYFGFNVVLQKGQQSAVIVAAPGNNSNLAGGSLHFCTIEDGKCYDYVLPQQAQQSPRSFTGNFLGAAIDSGDNVGDTLIVCAPKVVRNDYHLKGYCFLQRNTSSFRAKTYNINPFEYKSSAYLAEYYDYGFAEAGIDIHYIKSEDRVLIGAPGVKNWNGIFIAQPLSKLDSYTEIPRRTFARKTENFSYLGYKVTSARLEATRRRVWYVAGSPRGSELFGTVNIYESSGLHYTQIKGFEMGSYFGSSILAVDVTHDNVDDLLIGAPMGKGSSWDEGYVYFYRFRNKFENPILITGSKKVGGRFGTCITPLGDIDLDSYNDVAISAPYEDDGVGAVYIYMGSNSGLKNEYSQRISPLKFSPSIANVRGFGQGLSRGVDVDDNGHNDLAIGAYKSEQVFIMKTKGIINFHLTLEPNVSSLSSVASDTINVRYCIIYTQRSQTNVIRRINFKADLLFDYRTEGVTHITENLAVTVSKNYCKNYNLRIKKSPWDISAFKIVFQTEMQRNDLKAIGDNRIEQHIPYSHGCGSDNVCQTRILVQAFVPLENIVLGKHKEFAAMVSASNVGEPGYNCKLNLTFPTAIQLRDTKDCGLDGNTYVCQLGVISHQAMKEVQVLFSVKLREPEVNNITLNFDVKCLGEQDPTAQPDINKASVTLNVLLENSPYIQGMSVPDNFYFDDKNRKDVEISHVFKIDNAGPSPVKLGVFFLLPTIQESGNDIFVAEARGSLNGIQIGCYPTNKTVVNDELYEIQSYPKESLNNTVFIDCSQNDIQCSEIFCDGEYLYKSTEVAELIININVRTHLLAELYHDEIERHNILAYVSTAYLYDSSRKRIRGYAATQIFGSNKKPVPLWIYIVGSIIGVLLLALLIFVLYKCHFFDRNYKEKLKEEKLMDERMEEETEYPNVVEESGNLEDNSCQ